MQITLKAPFSIAFLFIAVKPMLARHLGGTTSAECTRILLCMVGSENIYQWEGSKQGECHAVVIASKQMQCNGMRSFWTTDVKLCAVMAGGIRINKEGPSLICQTVLQLYLLFGRVLIGTRRAVQLGSRRSYFFNLSNAWNKSSSSSRLKELAEPGDFYHFKEPSELLGLLLSKLTTLAEDHIPVAKTWTSFI